MLDTVKLAAFRAMPDQRAPLLSIKQKVDAARPLGFDKILQGPASNLEKAPLLLVTVTNCPADFGRLVKIAGEAVNTKFTVGWTERSPESVTEIVYVAGVAVWAIAKPPVTVPSVLIVQACAANGVRPAGVAPKVQLRAIVPFANPDPVMLTRAEPAVPYPGGALVGETKTVGAATTVKVALGAGATPLLGRTKT